MNTKLEFPAPAPELIVRTRHKVLRVRCTEQRVIAGSTVEFRDGDTTLRLPREDILSVSAAQPETPAELAAREKLHTEAELAMKHLER
jgi:hypothetical protein